MSIRTERVGAMLRQSLANEFQRHLPDYLDGMITVTAIKVSADLSIAKVYISIYHSKTAPDILIKRLNNHQVELRTTLAKDVRLRKMPELRFYRDDTLDTAEHIEKLLQDVREEDQRRKAERNGPGKENEGSSDNDG